MVAALGAFRQSLGNARPPFTSSENPLPVLLVESFARTCQHYARTPARRTGRSLDSLDASTLLEHASSHERLLSASIVEDHFKLILSRLQRVEDRVTLFSQGVHELAQRAHEAEARQYARLIAASEAKGVALNSSRRGQGRYREIYKREFERIYDVELNRLLTMRTLASWETLRGQPGKS